MSSNLKRPLTIYVYFYLQNCLILAKNRGGHELDSRSESRTLLRLLEGAGEDEKGVHG